MSYGPTTDWLMMLTAPAAASAAVKRDSCVGKVPATAEGLGGAWRQRGSDDGRLRHLIERREEDVRTQADGHRTVNGKHPGKRGRRPLVLDLVVERRLRGRDGEDHPVVRDDRAVLRRRGLMKAATACARVPRRRRQQQRHRSQSTPENRLTHGTPPAPRLSTVRAMREMPRIRVRRVRGKRTRCRGRHGVAQWPPSFASAACLSQR